MSVGTASDIWRPRARCRCRCRQSAVSSPDAHPMTPHIFDFPNYIYNDGYSIERGAARIVYSRYYADDAPYRAIMNQ